MMHVRRGNHFFFVFSEVQKMELQVSFVLLCLLVKICNAALLSDALGDNMVLQQQPQQARLWGWTTANAQVNVTIDGKDQYSSVAQSDGSWKVLLRAMP